jgi:hypothetical protein
VGDPFAAGQNVRRGAIGEHHPASTVDQDDAERQDIDGVDERVALRAGSAKAPPSLRFRLKDTAALISLVRDAGISVHPGSPVRKFVSIPLVSLSLQREGFREQVMLGV